MPTEKPILFSGPMVRAILSGKKTVTRRTVKPTLVDRFDPPRGQADVDAGYPFVECEDGYVSAVKICPYGQPGDRLWVRETWYCDHFEVQKGPYLMPADLDLDEARGDGTLVYAADGLTPYEAEQPIWKPSIHMPRWACRSLLEITEVRVERLRDMSGEQALAEGIYSNPSANGMYTADGDFHTSKSAGPVEAFAHLWELINGAGSWAANPWVWVVEFKRINP